MKKKNSLMEDIVKGKTRYRGSTFIRSPVCVHANLMNLETFAMEIRPSEILFVTDFSKDVAKICLTLLCHIKHC